MAVPPVPAHWSTASEALRVVEAVLAVLIAFRRDLGVLLNIDPVAFDHVASRELTARIATLSAVAAALHALGEAPAPFPPEALVEEVRHTVGLREALQRALPDGVAAALDVLGPPSPLRWTGTSPIIPPRFRSTTPCPAPALPLQRDLHGLVRGARADHLAIICQHVASVGAETTRAGLEHHVLTTLSNTKQVHGIAWMLSPTAHVLLNRLRRHGGELHLARLSSRWGPRLESGRWSEHGALAALESLGLAFVGKDPIAGDLRVVVPPDVSSVLFECPTHSRGSMVVKVALNDIEPTISRSIQLQASATFADLHFAIQAAFEWNNAHLFEFQALDSTGHTVLAGIPVQDDFSPVAPNARQVPLHTTLQKVGDACTYLYDFGACWSHTVVLVERSERPMRGHRRLRGGLRSSPPDECGGASGYARVVALLQSPSHTTELTELLESFGSWRPDAFDLDTARATFDV